MDFPHLNKMTFEMLHIRGKEIAFMGAWKYVTENKGKWITALLLILIIKIVTSDKLWVERFYSNGIYIDFSKIMRVLFGWIPFSLGDILYFLAACWLAWKLLSNLISLIKRKITRKLAFNKLLKLLLLFAFIYVVFYLFWGINYDRKGIAYQLQLTPQQYDASDLLTLQHLLLKKVNYTKAVLTKNHEKYPSTGQLIQRAKRSYGFAEKKFPFLEYKVISVKSSLYGTLGDYLGFTGYYNPFTGEAQINTTVPEMLQPYIATHEMAHQLGYAKENEANFVGYLAAVNSPDTLFHYSTYLDLFLYTNREVYYFDSTASNKAFNELSSNVKKDLMVLKKFDLDHQSIFEPLINWMYGNYLKLNNQPKGLHSYNAVVGMLIAYYKKYGKI